MKNKFEKDGIIIIKNGLIKKDLINLKKIVNKSSNYSHELFIKNLKSNNKKLYDYVLPFHQEILHKNLYQKVLKNPKVLDKLISLLGPDLAHHEDPSITVNISNLDDSKKNYLYKKWHQELWSGASTSTIAFWTPIFQPKNYTGQMAYIPGSHLWGHIPHKNREPLSLPSKCKVIKTKINEGDVILFHSLLLHSSVPINSKKFDARLALITHIRNFKFQNYSYDLNKSWRIFNFSEITKIEKRLGNHYLSPYRIIND